jgi:hypothetical protein
VTTKAAARAVAVVGAVVVGAVLWRASPHEVRLVYDVARVPGATSVEVTLSREGTPYRRAELSLAAGGDRTVHQDVSLPDGAYRLDFRIAAPAGAITGSRDLEVHEAGTIVLPLGP